MCLKNMLKGTIVKEIRFLSKCSFSINTLILNYYVTEQKVSNDRMPYVITVTQKNGKKENLGWKTKESLIEWHSAIDDVIREINKNNQQVCDVIMIFIF